MADIRINALATTAASTASDDFIAVDGSANGTRKLDAFSPTFGGNLTVSGGKVLISYPSSSQARVSFGGAHFDANSSYASYIRGYSSGATTAGLDFYTTYGSSVLALSLSEQGNATLAGNLLLGTTTDNSATFAANRTGTGPASSGSISTAAIRAVDVSNDLALDIGVNSAASPYPGWIQVHGRTNQATNYPLALNPNGGVVLVNTTANSGNGAIQLATHTTSAGGIGFGTDTSLYREAAGTLSINHSVGDSRLYFYNAGTAQGRVESASSNFFVTAMAGSLILRSGGATTALTLDSSQRCILAGALRLNNAYTAGAPTATGYVTLQDSAGNTYKVLVGT